jgi:hypothetical protein
LRSRRNWLVLAAFAAIVVAAAILRYWDLSTNPGGLFGDEAAEGLDAARMLQQPGFHPDWLVWFQGDAGREALFAYCVSFVFHFTGISVTALRATAAAFGVAGVIGIGALGRRFGTLAGLTAAAWAAGSLWLIVVSRDGMRNTIVPVFGALALGVLILWADRPSRLTAALAGAVVAISALYTYQPLKLELVLVPLWLLWLRRADRPAFERMRPGFLAAISALLVAAAPMLAVIVTEPASYFGRLASVSAITPGVQGDTSNFLIHALRTIGMFGFTGDGNPRQDVAGLPLISIPLAALAALGVWRLWRRRSDPAHALILIALPVFLVAPLAATEGWSPHFLRSLGLAAPLGVAIGLGAVQMYEFARTRGGIPAGRATVGLVAAGLVVTAVLSGAAYLTNSPQDRYEGYSYAAGAAGDFAAAHPGSVVVIDPFSAWDIEFEHWDAVPAIRDSGTRLPNPRSFAFVVGTSASDVRTAAGPGMPAPLPVAWDPAGNPTVWAIPTGAAP